MMAKQFKTSIEKARERFERRMNDKLSVEFVIIPILQPRKTWENGLTFKQLKEEVERRKNKIFSDNRIYDAVSLLNRFGARWDIYIRTEARSVLNEENKQKKEHRYYTLSDQFDISNEKKKLDDRKEIIVLKERHVEHHEKVSIPQKVEISQINRS